MSLSDRLDRHLTALAWSLWTELGVAGVQQKHRNYMIPIEELILLTATIGETDPRLRDEALDWCSRYHQFVSVSRLKALAKALGNSVTDPFSIFATTLNAVSNANWPIFHIVAPLKCKLSGKSRLSKFDSPSLLLLRLRSLFGVGSRADLIAFFFAQEESDYAIADTVEIGYSKRNLADMLEGFARAGIFEVRFERNQQRYRFIKRNDFMNMLGPIPKVMPSWHHFLDVVLGLRSCIQLNENKSEDTKAIELRNLLFNKKDPMFRLNLTPPSIQLDLHAYWDSFFEWFLKELEAIAEGVKTF